MGAGVEPCDTPSESFHVEVPGLEVFNVDVGDFEFSPNRRLKSRCDVEDAVIVEIESGDGIVGPGVLGFFLNGDGLPLLVEFNNAVTFGVLYPIAENGCAFLQTCSVIEFFPLKITWVSPEPNPATTSW